MIYPVGVDGFAKLRELGYVYVDKTRLIYKLIKTGSCYFLSRPRRFGKSLLISTIESYFLGKKELFKGLAIEHLENEWKEYPVLHFNLSNEDFSSSDGLKILLNQSLNKLETQYDIEPDLSSLSSRFENLILRLYNKKKQRIVVLIDEYDKPLLEALGNAKLQEEFRAILKPFYSTIKKCDSYLRFAMVTGVTKFGKLSIFSDLNNLEDISLQDEYAPICGITTEELVGYFDEEVRSFALKKKITPKEMYQELQLNYDGYHFSGESPEIYNPFSLFIALKNRRIGRYWFSTGTPSFLAKLLIMRNYDLSKLEGAKVSESVLESIDSTRKTPLSIIYQSGYLTIKGYNADFGTYTLGFPNKEVEQGFFEFLLPTYVNVHDTDSNFDIQSFIDDIRNGDADKFVQRLQSFYKDIRYDLEPDKERHFRNGFYILCKLLGFYVEAEYMTSDGRADLVIKTSKYIYVIECKYDKNSEVAFQQIEDKNYALPFSVDAGEIIKIGCNFSSKTCTLDNDWIIEKQIDSELRKGNPFKR